MLLKNYLKKDKIIILILLAFATFLIIKSVGESYLLNKHGVYVLGKLYSSSTGGEQGWVYKFKYAFKGKEYFKILSVQISKGAQRDSLMFFKILPNHPQVSRQLLNIQVPKCFEFTNIPSEGWQTLPPINCKD